MKYKQNPKIPQNIRLKATTTIINIIPNGNNYENIEKTSFLKNGINKTRSNKFLSIPERQRIIREINESKNQIDLNINLYDKLEKEKLIKKKNEDNKQLLYIKKTKSELNLFENKKRVNTNNRNGKNINSKFDIKFKDNSEFVNKAIKEYYKKVDNSFKNYLNTLNNRNNEVKKVNNNNISFFNNSNKNRINYVNNINNGNKSKDCYHNKVRINEKNINIALNEIYKKPSLNKAYNKNIITEDNHILNNRNNNINKNTFINLDNLCMISSARREKINCAKMINNNKNNGLSNNIFNKINNYYTTTFRNNSKNEKLIKLNFTKNTKTSNTKKDNLKKNNSSGNFIIKKPLKKKNKINELIFSPEINKENQEHIKSHNNNNIKYTKKNIKSPGGIQNKKRLFRSNLMNNDLPKIVVDNDIISIIPYENSKKNLDNNIISIKAREKEKIFIKTENNKINNNKRFILNGELFPNNNMRNKKTKDKNKIKSLTYSFKESPQKEKEEKKNKSFSYFSNQKVKKENNDYKNGRYHFKYKDKRNKTPLYTQKYKINYINQRNKNTMFREIYFKNINSYNNKEDEITNKNNYNDINTNKSYDYKDNNLLTNTNTLFSCKSNNNIFNYNNKSPMKEYYLNYFSNKINNDFLDEIKFNKFEKEILKKNSCPRNSEGILNSPNIDLNRQKTPLKTILRNYCPTTINSISKKEKQKIIKYNNSDKIKDNKNYLKTDLPNGKETKKQLSINLNNNWEEEENNNNNKIKPFEEIKVHKENIIKEQKNNLINKDKVQEQINMLYEINSSEKCLEKTEKINLKNNELPFKDNNTNINDNSKAKNIISKTESKNEEIIEKEKNNEEVLENHSQNIDSVDAKNSEESPKKNNYMNKRLKNDISLDILENINIISPKNYQTIKTEILNLIISDKENGESLFIDILYPIAINQIKYHPLYAKLCKDLDKYYNKKDKTKSIIRTQLMKLCKNNFKKIKINLENINDITSDINFIGELIIVQMVSKKVGIQCLNHLIDKFNQYSTDYKLQDKKEKYIYLDCYINLLDKFASSVKIYQKEKIREDELLLFENEINKNIKILEEINGEETNIDIPSKIKNQLVKLIQRAKNNWEISVMEKYKNELFESLYEDTNLDSTKNIKSFEVANSYDNKDCNSSISNLDKNEDMFSRKTKQYKSVSPINNINQSFNRRRGERLHSNERNTNNHNNKILNILSDFVKKIEKNLMQFKNHIDKYNTYETFNNWNDIDNLFLNKKIKKSEIFKSIIEACKLFISEKKDLYYVDIYIKIILEYYSNYLSNYEFNELINKLLENLSYLSDEELKKEENIFIIDIWIIIIYYLFQNNIMKMEDFDYFTRGYYTKDIKKNILQILKGVSCYKEENKKYYLNELKNTKFSNINKKIISEIMIDISY